MGWMKGKWQQEESGTVGHSCHANTREAGKDQEVKVILDYTEFQACLG